MTYLYVSKHVALLDTQNLLSKCSCISLLHIICMYVRMYVCTCVCVCVYVCMYVCMYVRVYVCMYSISL
jgi:hypothetical protein